jgi:hypothetical protein
MKANVFLKQYIRKEYIMIKLLKSFFSLSVIFMLISCVKIEVEPDYLVTASELINSYSNNVVSASIKYDGIYIELTGQVDNITGDKNEAIMIIDDEIHVVFTQIDEMFQLVSKGDVVILRGIIEGYKNSVDNKKVIVIKNAKVMDRNVPTLFVDLREIDDINSWYTTLIDGNVIEITGYINNYGGIYLFLIGLNQTDILTLSVFDDVDLSSFGIGDLVIITSVYNVFDQWTQNLIIKDIQKIQ